MKSPKNHRMVILTKEEVEELKKFTDDNLERGTVKVVQTHTSGIGVATQVMVTDLPETLTDITDFNYW